MSTHQQVTPYALGLNVLSVLLMSNVPVLVKFTSANEISIGISRLAIAALLLLPWVLWRGNLRNITGREWGMMILIGAVFALHWMCYFLSIKLATAAIGALAVSTFSVQYLILAHFVNGERVGVAEWLAVAACLLGCIITVPELSLQNDLALGMLVGVFSATLYAALPLLHQRCATVSNSSRSWGQFAFGLLFMLPFAGYTNFSALNTNDYYALLLLAVVCTVAAHSLWVKATTELPAIYPTLIYYLYMPMAMLGSAIFLDEEMTSRKLIGAALILCASTAIALYRVSSRVSGRVKGRVSARRH